MKAKEPVQEFFSIGDVCTLTDLKPHVLRYWEQEFSQLKPVKRRGNRRYYQHHEVLLIRRIRELLYEDGFTISGARNRLDDGVAAARDAAREPPRDAARRETTPADPRGFDVVEIRRALRELLDGLRA